jgi:flagellar motor switch protein FliM
MADVLSRSEVESLLAALDTGAGQAGQPDAAGSNSSSRISGCDFKRPERVSKEQMRTFQGLHESFSREFGAALSAMVRAIVEVKLICVDQLAYSEFVFSLENPTSFNLLKADPLDGHIILELNPSIIFPIIDRLLGGGRAPLQNVPRRPLTEIELRLASRITERAIDALRNAWSSVCDLSLKVTQVESNPQLVQIVPPSEVIVLSSFEISMGGMRGIMNLCIPFNSIEPLAGKLAANNWSSDTQQQPDRRQSINLEAGASSARVEMVVYLASTRLTAQELMGLAVGDVIVTENDHHLPLEVCVKGRPKYSGFAGLAKGHKAVRIGKAIVPPEQIVEGKLSPRTASR